MKYLKLYVIVNTDTQEFFRGTFGDVYFFSSADNALAYAAIHELKNVYVAKLVKYYSDKD